MGDACRCAAHQVKKGSITQPQALGLSAGLKSAGYALLCVGFAHSDLEVELQDPDEARRREELRAARADASCAGGRARGVPPGGVQVYDLQFGDAFRDQATSVKSKSMLRDDFALEIALGDE